MAIVFRLLYLFLHVLASLSSSVSNSGKPLVETTPGDWFVATQMVFHDNRYPSHIVLLVVGSKE